MVMYAKQILLLAAIISLLDGAAFAANRPDVRDMTCLGARTFVQDHRRVVMTTGTYTYDLIVAGHGLCDRTEYIVSKFNPTLDNPSCHIGYVCSARSRPFR